MDVSVIEDAPARTGVDIRTLEVVLPCVTSDEDCAALKYAGVVHRLSLLGPETVAQFHVEIAPVLYVDCVEAVGDSIMLLRD